MTSEDWVARINAASTTPVSYGGPSSSRRSSSEGTGIVYWGSVGEQVRVPVQGEVWRTQRVGNARIPDLPGRYRTTGQTDTRPDIKLSPVLKSEQEVREYVYAWYDTPQYDRLVDRLVEYGLIEEDEKYDIETVNAIWQDAVDVSMRMWANQKRVTPWDALRLLGGTGYVNGRSRRRTVVHRQVNLTNPTEAKALVNETLSRTLGRAATEEELRSFTAALNAAERANPTVTTTVYEGEDAASSTTTGGVDRGQVLRDQAMELPEYGAYQAATTYFNALLATLSSPV